MILTWLRSLAVALTHFPGIFLLLCLLSHIFFLYLSTFLFFLSLSPFYATKAVDETIAYFFHLPVGKLDDVWSARC